MTEPLRTKNDAMGELLRAAKQGGELPRPGSKERIWNELRNPKRPSAAWWLVPAAVAAAIVAVVFLPAQKPKPAFTLALASGDVRPGAVGAPVTGELRVAPKSRALAKMSSAGVLLHEGTTVSFEKELTLSEGSALIASSARLTARAKQYRADVESAVFQLEAAADAVTLQVSEGQVRVSGPETDVVVRAGESWSSRGGKGRAELSPTDVSALRALAEPGDAVLRIAKPAGAKISLDGVELGTAPLEVMVKRGDHHLEGVQGALRTELKATVGGGPTTTLELPQPKELPLPQVSFEPEEAEPVPEANPKRVDPPADPSKRYMLARSLAQKGRYPEALGIYEGLSRGASGWAEPSLYEVGRVSLRAKKYDAAEAALAAYRAKYPNGSLAHEVGLLSIEVQLKGGNGALALAAMDDFLVRFPKSERYGDVRFLRATVRRDRGDCEGAADDYHALVDHSIHGREARVLADLCDEQLGRKKKSEGPPR